MSLALALAATVSCRSLPAESDPVHRPQAESASPRRAWPAPFSDVTSASGVRFTNEHGSALPLTILEAMSGGAGLIDFDGDGRLDVFLVSAAGPNRLFRNLGGLRFRDVTEGSGVSDGTRYGMGACAGDYDNDGRQDLFVANHGRSTLLRNRGDGAFTDVTVAAGVALDRWSVSCVFFDYDRDGWLDLYVANYVDFERGPALCDAAFGLRTNCPPYLYPAQAHTLFHNEGDGTFRDVSEAAGITRHEGRGMGVIAFDYNDDGLPDVAVANDGDPNFLFVNRGDGTFREVGMQAGIGLSLVGRATSSMGLDFADVDGDGRLDFSISTFRDEPQLYLRNIGKGWFSEESELAGLARATLPYVGWGMGFVDFDQDGDKDLLVINGHVRDNARDVEPGTSFAQPPQLFENRGGSFVEASAEAGPFFARPVPGRGAAFGDLDDDGDVDVVVNMLGASAVVLRNDLPRGPHWLEVELVGARRSGGVRGASRTAAGSRVIVTAGGRRQVDEVRAGGSYASFNDPRLHFGLGRASRADVEIHWLGGDVQTLRGVPADRYVRIAQGGTIKLRTARR